jgi:hypothetical protein
MPHTALDNLWKNFFERLVVVFGRQRSLIFPSAGMEVAKLFHCPLWPKYPRRSGRQTKNIAKQGSVLKNTVAGKEFAQATEIKLPQAGQNL